MIGQSLSRQLLSQFFGHVVSGQEYVISRLDSESTITVTKTLSADPSLAAYLDCLLVCSEVAPMGELHELGHLKSSQYEITNLVLDSLLRSTKAGEKNMLTLGYTRGNERDAVMHVGQLGGSVVNDFPNSHISTLRSPIWQKLLCLIGEGLMLEMLCQTNIFVQLDNDSFYQLTGHLLSETTLKKDESRKRKSLPEPENRPRKRSTYGKHKIRSNHDIAIVRSRLFYSRPALNGRGEVIFGLQHIHTMNRFANLPRPEQIRQMLHNMFPLQHKLHNVFSSEVNKRETVQPLKDYTMREDVPVTQTRRPKSLPHALVEIVDDLQSRHNRTSFKELLTYHCPSETRIQHLDVSLTSSLNCLTKQVRTQKFSEVPNVATSTNDSFGRDALMDGREIFTNFSTSPSSVTAFAVGVLRSVMPPRMIGLANFDVLAAHLSTFIHLRRYESMTLQDFMTGLSITGIPWLVPDRERLCLSATRKKEELLAEMVYWIIDSLVVPLLKAHFYITESHLFRNRVLYFRHDIWKRLTEPELAKIRLGMLSEVPTAIVTEILKKRALGFAYMRLLPKGRGVRPITNLRRREMTKDGTKRTKGKYLLPSINSIMQSVYSVLKYENRPDVSSPSFGVQSVQDIHMRLKAYKVRLESHYPKRKIYFAKVDVRNCFDTIEQDKVLDIVSRVLREDEYMLQKFCAIVPTLDKVGRKYHNRAIPAQDLEDFEVFAREYVGTKKHVILVDNVTHQFKDQAQIRELLKEHLTMHLIKIGKKFFRQDTGIPQGSILSSILCDLYYSEMEAKTLAFMNRHDSVCFRLIDDFLYITTDRESAERFLTIMHEGNPEYGCFVSSEKSLTNFEYSVCGERISTLAGTLEFPYCGTTINTTSLDIRKDFSRTSNLAVSDTLTVDFTRNPGKSLLPKVFQGLKLSCQPMYIDTSHNNLHTVMLNIYRSFVFAAMRFHVFINDLKRQGCDLKHQAFGIVQQLTGLLFVFLKSRSTATNQIQCDVTQTQVLWLGMHAFHRVLRSRPAGYEDGLLRLRQVIATTYSNNRDRKILAKVTKDSNVECFADFVY